MQTWPCDEESAYTVKKNIGSQCGSSIDSINSSERLQLEIVCMGIE